MATTKMIQSIERAFAIIEFLESSSGDEKSIKEIADAVQLNKSTVFGIVNTLAVLGYLTHDPNSQKYSLGLRFLGISEAISKNNAIIRIVHPYLKMLSDTYDETIHCAVQSENRLLYIDKVVAQKVISINSQIGRYNYLHSTGVGKCFLAFMEEKELNDFLNQEELVKFTDTTITDPKKMRKELAEIRRNGYSIDNEEGQEGVYCIAVPIFYAKDRVGCAMSLSCPIMNSTKVTQPEVIDHLKEISRRISKELYSYTY